MQSFVCKSAYDEIDAGGSDESDLVGARQLAVAARQFREIDDAHEALRVKLRVALEQIETHPLIGRLLRPAARCPYSYERLA